MPNDGSTSADLPFSRVTLRQVSFEKFKGQDCCESDTRRLKIATATTDTGYVAAHIPF